MKYTADEQNLIVLSSFEEVTFSMRQAIAAQCENSTQFLSDENFLIKTLSSGVYNIVKDRLKDDGYRRALLESYRQKDIVCVTILSPLYPTQLKSINSPPLVLYCRGDVNLLSTNCFAIVGSRRTTAPALALCERFSAELSAAFTIVTGIADGADTAAIKGALKSGKIISVLANGLDRVYPSSNSRMYNLIAEKGLLVSEYLPHIQPYKYNFPMRNRIIAALSRGTLVVSAGKKSGALITADCAIEYGRDVFAVPYFAGSPSGAGCNKLIKSGAYLAESVLDIFEVYGLDLTERKEFDALTDDEAAILAQVQSMGEAFLPQIAQSLNKQPYEIIAAISSLEIKGRVIRLGGNRYAATE